MSNIRGGHKRLFVKYVKTRYLFWAFGLEYINSRECLRISAPLYLYNYYPKEWYLYLGNTVRQEHAPLRLPTMILLHYVEGPDQTSKWYIEATKELSSDGFVQRNPPDDLTSVDMITGVSGTPRLLYGGCPGLLHGTDIVKFYYVIWSANTWELVTALGNVDDSNFNHNSVIIAASNTHQSRSIHYNGKTYVSRSMMVDNQHSIRHDYLLGNGNYYTKKKGIGFTCDGSTASKYLFSVVEEVNINGIWYPVEIRTYNQTGEITELLPNGASAYSKVTYDGTQWNATGLLPMYGIEWAMSNDGTRVCGIYTSMDTAYMDSSIVTGCYAICSVDSMQTFTKNVITPAGDEDFYYLADKLIDESGNLVLGRGYDNPYLSYASANTNSKHYYGAIYNVDLHNVQILPTGNEITIGTLGHDVNHLSVISDYSMTGNGEHVIIAGSAKYINFWHNVELISVIYVFNYITNLTYILSVGSDNIFTEDHCCTDIIH